MSRVALVTSVAHVFVGVGHTVRTTQRRVSILTANKVFGLGMFSNPKWSSVPSLLYAYARVGWYQGSLFFTIAGLYTYQLSQRDPSTWSTIDRTISAMTLALYWASSAWYFRNGDRPTGTLTAVVGGLQALCLAQ